MKRVCRCLAVFALPICFPQSGSAAEPPSYLTYDNTPLGTVAKPLILRTYMPDPGLADDVFPNHGKGYPAKNYNPGAGKDVEGERKPVMGIPAAVGVNHGAALSYCFDTTECRLMYAWQGGFLDMYPYWGDRARGHRQSFIYVPRLVGNLFYRATGKHPLQFDGKSISELGEPDFRGYQLAKHIPEFSFAMGEAMVTYRVEPTDDALSLKLKISCSHTEAAMAFREAGGKVHTADRKGGSQYLAVTIKGTNLQTLQGFPRNLDVKKADPTSGKRLYLAYGCMACHSLDGSKSHGPTLGGLFDRERELEGGDKMVADEAYLLESIRNPNAKIAKGFPPSYMPPYQLKDIEYQALVAFIKSLTQPE